MTLAEALQDSDMDEIIDSMTAYVYSHIKTIGIKDLQGKCPEDFVGDILLKVVENERDWSKAKCSFREFLFGCLKSHLSNFFSSYEPLYESDLPDKPGTIEFQEESSLKNTAIKLLTEDGANSEEIAVFECWIDGIVKPQRISEQLVISVNEIYNIIKRLERRIPKLKSQILNYV